MTWKNTATSGTNSSRASSLSGLDENDKSDILVYKHRSGSNSPEVSSQHDLGRALDFDNLPFSRITKKEIPRDNSRLELRTEDLFLPEDLEKYAEKPTLSSSLTNVGLPSSAYWKRLLSDSFPELNVVSKSLPDLESRASLSDISDNESEDDASSHYFSTRDYGYAQCKEVGPQSLDPFPWDLLSLNESIETVGTEIQSPVSNVSFSSSNEDLFSYKPLKLSMEIRLVEILEGDSTDPLKCRIFHALSKHQDYDAVSYTWGNEDHKVLLPCLPSGNILVTANCEAALRALRLQDKPKVVWIDAIGINQKDIKERNEQVQLMAHIFGQARRVLIYLGEEHDNSSLGLDHISTGCLIATDSLVKEAVQALLVRPWFSRTWVLQEVALSQSAIVICGSKEVAWEQFLKISPSFITPIPSVISLGLGASRGPRPRKSRKQGLYNPRRADELIDLLNQTRHCKCKDPRDKIFGVLSLFDESLKFHADYAMLTVEVFTRAAITMLKSSGIRVLSATQGKPAIDGLPTWVPNWSIPHRQAVLGATSANFRAGKRFEMNISFLELPNTTALKVRGMRLDKIQTLGEVFDATDRQRWLDVLMQWRDIAKVAKTGNQQKFLDSKVLEAMGCPWDYRGTDPNIDRESKARLWHGRRIFTTTNGFVGLAPHEAEKDDLLCILFGGNVPYILRKRDSYFNFVGESFVQGIMAGEALSGQDWIDFEELEIR